ncbi:MAG: hypothetical protein RJA36_1577 [Pseudomonadota bacterium]|jgi:uncharacterized protein (DUF58 family)
MVARQPSGNAGSGPDSGHRRAGRPGWRGWWLRRQPALDRLELTQRNVYILPTRPGLMLALTLLLLLVGSINYQLNLGYLLTFLLGGASAVALHLTHANLRGLCLQLRPGDSVFAGQAATVAVTLHNPGRRARYGIALDWLAPPGAAATPASAAWADVPARGQAELRLSCLMARRGRQGLPALQAETRFPLGAFRAWCWWRPAATLLVYPEPESQAPPLPRPVGHREGAYAAPRPDASDEFEGLRPWRQGDPLRRVAWKKVARQAANGREHWISRDFSAPAGSQCWLDASQTGLSDPERRLSRLCAWVLRAESLGLDYGLRLGALEIAPGRGAAHRTRCLEALALC